MTNVVRRALLAGIFAVLALLAPMLIDLAMNGLAVSDADPAQYWGGFVLFVLAAATPFAALIWATRRSKRASDIH